MPSLSTARRIASSKNNGAKTLGQMRKEFSDWAMEETWDGDIQSKLCYIYDYFHDDKPELAEDITYENTTKTRIDAKFIVTKYASIDKDQVEYHLQFKPSQKVRFDQADELFYFETDYKKRYGVNFPIGLYVDIPDEKNVYKKWIIVAKEDGNQFIKYSVLPCDYRLQWIEHRNNERIKRQMWVTTRSMNNYTSGRWADYYFTTPDNIEKIWAPLNSISERLSYLNGDGKNQRIAFGILTENPLVWQISKVEGTKPIGILKITLDQDTWDSNRDYVNFETGEMYADYYDSEVIPHKDMLDYTPTNNYAKISATTTAIKAGGSYKTLTVNICGDSGLDITEMYDEANFNWSCSIDGTDVTDSPVITWRNGSHINQKKIKFAADRTYLDKSLQVQCIITKDTEVLKAMANFEISI